MSKVNYTKESIADLCRRNPYFIPQIIKDYQAGMTVGQVGVRHELPGHWIIYLLRREGISLRRTRRRYFLDESSFDHAEKSPVAAYWVGFLMADGCVRIAANQGREQHTLTLSLAGEDGSHVLALRDFLKADYPVQHVPPGTYPNAQPQIKLKVESQSLIASLSRYGVVPLKSMTAKVLVLQDNPFFWAGMVCGDGWFTTRMRKYRYPVIGLTNSLSIMTQFREYCHTLTGTWPKIGPNGGIWKLTYSCRAARIITRALFANAPFALPRKLAIAREIMAEKDKF